MKAGDVLGFSGQGLVSGFINLATFGIPHRNLSHVGIIAHDQGRLRLFESTIENGVEAVPIERRINRYIGKVWHFGVSRDLYDFEEDRLSDFLNDQLGKPYDLPGAVRAAGYLTASVKAKLTKPDLSKLYCSELVAASHNAIGLFPTPNPARWSPNTLVRAERQAGILQAPERLK